MLAAMEELLPRVRDLVLRHAGAALPAGAPQVGMFVGRSVTTPVPTVYEPMVCIVLQGAKHVFIGDRHVRYDTASYLVATLDLPASSCVVEATAERPYVAANLPLNRAVLAELMVGAPARPGPVPTAGFAVTPMTADLLDVWLRLLRLYETPADAPVLGPMLEREILYRLLQGPQGEIARQAALSGSRVSKVRTAIGWIRDNFDKALRVESLADMTGMSPASFHRHFKAATAMSPLQYQKAIRLQEARRLLLVEQDAARAGYRVGYGSASQFSREYARMYGAPPARDAARLRAGGGLEALAA